ncbi:SCP-2 sterol transfer family domain-containing protein [Ditylenchus destructor]|uniref:Sterol carrier protein 2 n=1 Tax=Ditylenchus destructor TaxID=166010 RepID=A0AAD4N4H1_9BILA|nr:SCP-2 sterol transfer family domain-containing protein [Ditylenchus destructor]
MTSTNQQAQPPKPKVYIVGVGMTKFSKPQSTGLDYPDLVKEAVTEALDDAKLKYENIQQATASYMYGGSCCGQRALYEIGLTGIPIFNLNNACASGSTGIFLCKQIIEGGNVDVMLAVGFEKMAPGSLEKTQPALDDRAHPVDKHIQLMADTYGLQAAPVTSQMFGNAGREHMEKYGTTPLHFAKIAYKNHLHSTNNPKSQFQKKFTLDEVVNARKIFDFMGLLECSPTSDGAAAVIVVSERFLNQNPHLKKQAVEIVGIELGTDEPSVFAEKSNIKMIGFDLIKKISDRLYKKTGVSPKDVQVIELHDCFSTSDPTSDGAAAVIVVSERFLNQNPHLKKQAVEIVGIELGTDEPSVFAEKSNIKMIGFDLIKKISDRLYKKTGVSPKDVQVIELHDCFSTNELISYESLGLCPVGKGGEIVDKGDNTYGGKWVVNPSGGLISKGHPIGATGVAQAVELCNQLRGRCGPRQVPNCKYALQHNIGIGGAGVVALYKLASENGQQGPKPQSGVSGSTFKSDAIFEEIRGRASEEKDLAKQINASYRFTITDSKGQTKNWTIDMKKDTPFVGENNTDKVDTEIALKDDDFMKLAAGQLKPDQAFMQGKMKIKGNIVKAMKLKNILDPTKLKSRL